MILFPEPYIIIVENFCQRSTRTKILIIEDDLNLINGLSFAIKKQGYDLDIARTSADVDAIWEDGKYDLVILDVSLPYGSGFDICKKSGRRQKCRLFFSPPQTRKRT